MWHKALPEDEESRAVATLRILSAASRTLASSIEYRSTLPRIAELTVPALAEACVIEVLEEDREIALLGVQHADPKKTALIREMHSRYASSTTDRQGAASVIRSGKTEIYQHISDADLVAIARDDEHLAILRKIGWHAVMVVPLTARDEHLGAITFANSHRGFAETDIALAEEIALRAAIAIDSARLYTRERRVADTLQRALLPDALPDHERLSLNAAYLPGAKESAVGGDWYDAFNLPDGRIALSIGDVAGHGLKAAVVMGEVRQTFRAAALNAASPSVVLQRANQILHLHDRAGMVTAIFAVYDPANLTLTYATAGHPAPILATKSGLLNVLPSDGPPLGISPDHTSTDWTFSLLPGSLLVFYTDGLIEYNRNVIEGEAKLVAAIAEQVGKKPSDPARSIQRTIFADARNTDDVAILTLSIADAPIADMHFSYSAIPMAAPLVRHAIRTVGLQLGLDEDQTFTLQVAVGEAVANAVEHAYGGQPGIFHVEAHEAGGALTVSIEDHGRWRPPQRRDERGRGLPIMRALMDGVQIRSNHASTAVKLTLSVNKGPS